MVHRACVRRLQVERLKCQTFESLLKNNPLGVNSACSNVISIKHCSERMVRLVQALRDQRRVMSERANNI